MIYMTFIVNLFVGLIIPLKFQVKFSKLHFLVEIQFDFVYYNTY